VGAKAGMSWRWVKLGRLLETLGVANPCQPRSKCRAHSLNAGTNKWALFGLNIFQTNFNPFQTFKFNADVFPCSKNIQTLHEDIFEYFEQLSQLGRLQIPNQIHAIYFGTDSNLRTSPKF
jgi:hypothetical protein